MIRNQKTRAIAPQRRMANDLFAADALTFLMKELEKVDEKIQEPLTGTDWPRDMPVQTGGGYLESISSIDIRYLSSGQVEDNIIFDQANNIPVIQADMNKAVARCFNFAEFAMFSMLEEEKLYAVGRDIMTYLDKGIRLHLDKYIDTNVYKGFNKTQSVGLVNAPGITRAYVVPHTSGGTDTQWSAKTADEILNDINTAISALWNDNDCSSDALPNHILVPVEQFGMLVTRKVSDDSERSILKYIEENNITTRQGGELIISPCKWCKQAGASGTDRMVVYMNREDRICFNLTQPLRRYDPQHNDLFVKIPFVAQFSEVRFLYPSTVRYADGI